MSNLAIDRVTSDAGARGACDVPAAAVQRPRWLSRARLLLALSLAAASVAFVVRSRAASHAAVPPVDQGQRVVATLGARTITLADIDAVVGEEVFDARSRALENLVADDLLSDEAAAQGLGVPELLEREVNAKVAMPDRDALRQLYAAAQARGRVSPDISFEAAEEGFTRRIRDQGERAKRREYVARLRRERGARVNLRALNPPRDSVAPVGPSLGPASAKVTIIEFADFESEFCAHAEKTIHEVLGKYGDRVRLVFRNNPLSKHAHAERLATAAVCASDRNQFWPYHDYLFNRAGQADSLDPVQAARDLGLDVDRFVGCLGTESAHRAVQDDMRAANAAHLGGTPAFLVNGRHLNGAVSSDDLSEIIDEELTPQ